MNGKLTKSALAGFFVLACCSGCWLFRGDLSECSSGSDEQCASGESCYRNNEGGEPIYVCLPSGFAACLEGGTDAAVCVDRMDAALFDQDVGGDADGNDLDAGEDSAGDTPPGDSGGDDDGNDLEAPDAPPAVPNGVSASDGESPEHVTVSWNASPGAASYRVLRDDVEIASAVAAVVYDDPSAQARPPSAAGFNLTASDGEFADFVRLSWTAPAVPTGVVHEYRVVAENAVGQSTPSAPDLGYRGPAPITGYEVSVDDGDWLAVGSSTSYDDASAPAGALVSAGNAVASDGTDLCGVSLALEGVETEPGATVSYRVRAINDGGPGTAFTPDAGYRADPVLETQWQRSLDEGGEEFEDISDASGLAFTDTSGPLDDSVRAYRAQLTPLPAGEPATSQVDEGSRSVMRLEGSADSGFGWSMALSGDRLLVGAQLEPTAIGVGRVHAFRFVSGAGWLDDGVFTPTEGANTLEFGHSISLSGLEAAVGRQVPDDGYSDLGGVYIYRREAGGWTQIDFLDGDRGAGWSVALEGDALVVGAPWSGMRTADGGGAHAFSDEETGWVYDDDLVPPSANAFDGFGWAVAMSGNRAVLGSIAEPGAALAFHRAGSTWGLVDRIDPPVDTPSPAQFGFAVAISGDQIAVGAPYVESPISGTAFIYSWNGTAWVAEGQVGGTDPSASDHFGSALALSGDLLVVGAPFAPNDAGAPGAAYLFRRNEGEWQLRARLVDSEHQGLAVAMSGQWLAVGTSCAAVRIYCVREP